MTHLELAIFTCAPVNNGGSNAANEPTPPAALLIQAEALRAARKGLRLRLRVERRWRRPSCFGGHGSTQELPLTVMANEKAGANGEALTKLVKKLAQAGALPWRLGARH